MIEAVDPLTGEINWDCECLKDYMKGPCIELFKRAFKCFVENQDDPSKYELLFKEMQNCFDKYPETYANH